MKHIFDAPGKFLGFQTPYEEAEFVIQPFPYEFTTTFGKGTKLGPSRVLEVSDNLEMYEEETGEEPYLRGIHTAAPLIRGEIGSEEDVERISYFFQKYVRDRKKLITIGGEHTISYPIVKAFKEKYENIGLFHFDAHGDYRNIYEGSKYNHACVLRRIANLDIRIVSSGIRAISLEEVEFVNRNDNIMLFMAHEIKNYHQWLDRALKHLPEQIYISFDVDFFDPSLIRATGTPEPGGFDWYETLKILKRIFETKKVLGVDIVEICPDPPYEVSTYTIAKLIYKIVSVWK